MSLSRARATSLVVAGLTVAGLVVPAAVAGPPAAASPVPPSPNAKVEQFAARAKAAKARGVPAAATPALAWKPCGSLQCATLVVPLDHAKPSAGTTTLTITRRPADNPKARKGVIFTDPGGPGVPASLTVPLFAQTVGRTMRGSFDIVGVDPRGTGGTDMEDFAVCAARGGETLPDPGGVIFPRTTAEVAARLKYDEAARDICDRHGPKILRHMTTADTARDLDRVRAAMGQAKLNYYGVSYGSYLGMTYANLFPQRVGAMVIEGVLDPVEWATGRGNGRTVPMTSRIGSHRGTQEALMSAIAACERASESRCPQRRTIRDDWTSVRTRLAADTRPLDQQSMPYPLVISLITSSLYDGEAVPEVMLFIHTLRGELDAQRSATAPAQRAKATSAFRTAYARLKARDEENRRTRIAYDPPAPPDDEPTAFVDVTMAGVMCSDSVDPVSPLAWQAGARAADRVAPGFGSLWTWQSSICAKNWPAGSTGAYSGPFTKKPAKGILVMSTKHDPATPYSGAQAVRRLSPGSRLVTVDGWGHGVLDMSGCASWARTRYFMTGALPKTDITCRPDRALFPSLD